MKKNNRMLYGFGGLILGFICMKWMKEDVFSILGMFDVTGKTFGIIFLVMGGWNLVEEIAENDEFAALLEEIISLPFRLLGWLFKRWFLVLVALLVFNWMDDRNTPAPEESILIEATEATEQVVPAATEPPRICNKRDKGLCKTLTQDSQVLLIFVNDDESSWTKQETDWLIHDLANPALEFIEYHAGQYGYDISMESRVYADDAGNIRLAQVAGTLNDGNSVAPGSQMGGVIGMQLRAAAQEAFGQDMIKDAQTATGTDQIAVVYCVNKPGRSFATGTNLNSDAVETVVLFSSYKDQKSLASTFAHELMHLYGAEDMYGEGDLRANRSAMAKELHPQELYISEMWNLYDHTISDFTAYAVGWLDTLPAEYDCPEWWS